MMRSLFSGVSGLRAHQQKMDVIGNNVANVNTVGFKAGRVTFSDIFSQTLKGATGPDSTTGRGGINPMQVGLGLSVASVDTVMTRGSTETTGNQNDLCVDGNGFFIVRSGTTGMYMFTRAGNFTLDKSGNLVTADGMNVYGWLDYGGVRQNDGSYKFDTDRKVEPINIYSDSYNNNKRVVSAKATENVSFSGSLDSSEEALGTAEGTAPDTSTETPHHSTTMTVYDSLGNSHEVEVNFYKCYVNTGDASNPLTVWYWEIPGSGGTTVSGAGGFIEFESDGDLFTGDASFPITGEVTFTPAASTGAAPFTVRIDFSDITASSADSSVEADLVDGYPAGTLEDYSIGADGIIMGVYSNGQQQPLGMIALAGFANPAGLSKAGSNYYAATANSGDFVNGVAAGSGGTGLLSAGSLEMSNVDLSNEFSAMIITQRGFQANSRIITTADEMLQELVNLKR